MFMAHSTTQMEHTAYCEKDQCQVEIDKGCRHPTDYCQFRKACIIHFMNQEKSREKRRKTLEDE
ncbi:MAG TPA: hypothetical protein EYP57_10375 [Thermodesulfobacteriaceae bacterium]|nr:hypothetical protein [Thermodesulfobacteriaceae bacterium]